MPRSLKIDPEIAVAAENRAAAANVGKGVAKRAVIGGRTKVGPAATPRARFTGVGIALPLMCAGLGTIAACILLPAVMDNRVIAAQNAELDRDLKFMQQQIDENEKLFRSLPTQALAQRLELRQFNRLPAGEAELPLSDKPADRSPFSLSAIADAPPVSISKPSGWLVELLRSSLTRVWVLGAGVLAVAMGTLLGRPQ